MIIAAPTDAAMTIKIVMAAWDMPEDDEVELVCVGDGATLLVR